MPSEVCNMPNMPPAKWQSHINQSEWTGSGLSWGVEEGNPREGLDSLSSRGALVGFEATASFQEV